MIERLGNLLWLLAFVFLAFGVGDDSDDGYLLAVFCGAIAYVCRGLPWKRPQQATEE